MRAFSAFKYFLLISSNDPYQNTKLVTFTIAEGIVDGISGPGSSTVEKLLLLPKVMLASNKRICKVIQVSYELNVEAEVSGCYKSIEVIIPITIGPEPIVTDAKTAYSGNGMSSAIKSMPVAPVHGLRKEKFGSRIIFFKFE